MTCILSQMIQCIKFHPSSVGSILILFCLHQSIPSDMFPLGCISVRGCFTDVVKKKRAFAVVLCNNHVSKHLLTHNSAIRCERFIRKCKKYALRRCARCRVIRTGVAYLQVVIGACYHFGAGGTSPYVFWEHASWRWHRHCQNCLSSCRRKVFRCVDRRGHADFLHFRSTFLHMLLLTTADLQCAGTLVVPEELCLAARDMSLCTFGTILASKLRSKPCL